jgi:hypothetical protein
VRVLYRDPTMPKLAGIPDLRLVVFLEGTQKRNNLRAVIIGQFSTLLAKISPHRSPMFASVNKLDDSPSANLFHIGEQPYIDSDSCIVKEMFGGALRWPSDNRVQ